MNKIGFGTYRITQHNLEHIEAIKEAIRSGVRLIDTSSNYMDGSSEQAIAFALAEFDDSLKDEIKIISKVGYIQGSNLDTYHCDEEFRTAAQDVVMFSEDCYHSIAPSFIKDQLTRSLQRLNMSKIDSYLLHNPEYFILDAINSEMDQDDMLDEMYERIYDAFIALENEVRQNRINSYGISSNSFSKPHNSPEFLPYEDLLTLAEKAARYVGNEVHSFTTVELPINILEREGLKCAAWAKENGLRVLANRPLNALYENNMYRLADYIESEKYFGYLNELLDTCDQELLRPVYNLVEQLDENVHKFGWIGDYESFLYSQVIPHIQAVLQYVDEDSRELLLHLIENFLREYKEMVLFECSKRTRVELKEFFIDCEERLQNCALNFLLKNSDIDYVLIGMRKVRYVSEVRELQP